MASKTSERLNTDIPRAKSKQFNFEAALANLNQLVEKMESGGLTLEDSLKYFEEGIALTRQCQQALKEAEQKVQILLKKNDQSSLETYTADPNE